MKFSTILSTLALASVSTATAIDPNMGQERFHIVARSPGKSSGESSSRGAKGGSSVEFPQLRHVSNDYHETMFFEVCMEDCRRKKLREGKIKSLTAIDKACEDVCLPSLKEAKKAGSLKEMMTSHK